MTFRCVIFAAVSTPEQAESDRASIPSQIESARATIRRREWQEATDPLVVPGQSRSLDFLHEAVAEIRPIADLVDFAKRGEIDLVIVRDYDRLARTRSLLTQLSTYLSHCGVQIYAIDKPVEPVPASDMHRRRAVYSSATVEAFAGLEAEREVARLVERRYFGVNAAMKDGRWVAGRTAYGYTREPQNGHRDSYNAPRIVPKEAEIVRRIERMYLDEGMGFIQIARQLNVEGIPAPSGKQWLSKAVGNILRNAFYCGWIVWGLQRRRTVFDPAKNQLVTKSVWVPSYKRIRASLGGTPGLFDLLEHRVELEADGVVLAEGQHEPLRSLDQQRGIEQEIASRFTARGRAASKHNPNVFAGLVRCGDCGRSFTAQRGGKPTARYGCSGRQNGRIGCDNPDWISEDAIYSSVMGVLQAFADKPDVVDLYLARLDSDKVAHITEEASSVRQAIENVDTRRTRWDDAYGSGVIDLETYSKRLTMIQEEQRALLARDKELRMRLSQNRRREELRTSILESVQSIPPLDNRIEFKLAIRRLISRIVVMKGEVTEIVFRDT